jgi:phytoene dehydrogenase-like protein
MLYPAPYNLMARALRGMSQCVLPQVARIQSGFGVRYDAAIIGAGANGLTAAAILSRAGLNVLVVERAARPGGRLVTNEFYPGFAASLFADRVPAIPVEIMAALELAVGLQIENPPHDICLRRDGALARIFAEARTPHRHTPLARLRRAIMPLIPAPAWPGQDLAGRALSEWPDLQAWALLGRATDPDLAGSAMTLLALSGAEPRQGGLGAVGEAFIAAAAATPFRLGVEASEIVVERGRFASRATGLLLADGSLIEADAVISTLDFKRSTLALFPWAGLPSAMTASAAQFRMGGGAARLLLALKRPAGCAAPLLLPGDAGARAAFRRGAVPHQPSVLIDPVSMRDPSLAPADGAVLTVTMTGIPGRLFDGTWTAEKRAQLAAATLRRIEAALPGTLAALTGIRVVVPPDMETRLGISEGDLDGGQLSPDQMLGLRPGARTQLPGFYLGGASAAAGPLGTGAAGYAAALSLLADR